MNTIAQFIFRHPFISYLIGSCAMQGLNRMTQTIAYAITGREGLKPTASVNISVDPSKKKEDTDNEPSVIVE